MATKEEQQRLIDTLKFTPRTYKVSLWGYGGEKVMGRVDPKAWDYCMENQVDLVEIAWADEDTVQDDMGLDLDQLPFYPGQWYECDGFGHINGVSKDAGTIQVEDENGNTVYEERLENLRGFDGPGLCCNDEVWVGMADKGDVVFVGSSNEKGTFFEGEIPLRAPFDIEKLELHYDDFDGEEIINSVYYDGEEIENWGGGTDGKSSDMIMVRILDDDKNFERYEPGEKDWGEPPCGPSPSDWEKSPEFKFKKHKPVHTGWYRACWHHFGTSLGTLYWDGTNFVEFEYGKPNIKENVDTWQGYNWDTSDWSNQPPEPPSQICKNKKCGWTGQREQCRRDEDYNDHCPECDGTDFDWIDYDPMTKTGLANRKKYCQPATPKDWDPVAELDKILTDFEQTGTFETPWTPVKTKPVEPGVYECQFKKAPAWPWPPVEQLQWDGKQWLNDDGDAVKGVKEWRGLKDKVL